MKSVKKMGKGREQERKKRDFMLIMITIHVCENPSLKEKYSVRVWRMVSLGFFCLCKNKNTGTKVCLSTLM